MSAWTHSLQPLLGSTGMKLHVRRANAAATLADVLEGFCTDAAFRDAFNGWLAALPYGAFRWETPPAASSTLAQPFECAVVDHPALARPADPSAFAEHFRNRSPAPDALEFPNLGGDAILVVPTPCGSPRAHGHLAAFVREGPAAQRDAFWRRLGEAMTRRVGARPVWLSTAGDGVPWLHARLDDRPKYYRHGPYRTAPGA